MNGVVIPSFESENPGIKVVDDTLPYAGMLQKFIASSAAGDPRDLMRSDIAWVPQLASEGTLLETSTNLGSHRSRQRLIRARCPRTTRTAATTGSPTTRTPRSSSGTRLTSGSHLSPPTTWDQMIADAKLLTIPSRSNTASA